MMGVTFIILFIINIYYYYIIFIYFIYIYIYYIIINDMGDLGLHQTDLVSLGL